MEQRKKRETLNSAFELAHGSLGTLPAKENPKAAILRVCVKDTLYHGIGMEQRVPKETTWVMYKKENGSIGIEKENRYHNKTFGYNS